MKKLILNISINCYLMGIYRNFLHKSFKKRKKKHDEIDNKTANSP